MIAITGKKTRNGKELNNILLQIKVRFNIKARNSKGQQAFLVADPANKSKPPNQALAAQLHLSLQTISHFGGCQKSQTVALP